MNHIHKHTKSRRLMAGLLCLSMVMSMISSVGVLTAYAASATDSEIIVADSRVSDPDTTDTYIGKLLNSENGSRYAGRVWTDKSVFAYGYDNGTENDSFDGNHTLTLNMETDGYDGEVDFNADFSHVFSALTSSQRINEYPPTPIDLVIVFDMSGSMGQDTRYSIDNGLNAYVAHVPGQNDPTWPQDGVPMADRIKNSRIQKTLDAINQTIDRLMAQNPQNRVAVCGYGANATVLMPLGHYRRNGGAEYLSVGGMETLYHPSDLVYKDSLRGDKPEGWYWQNNRDTCYTVVVNAQYNTYTGVLDEDGDGSSAVHADMAATDYWTTVQKTVSNNVLDNAGNPVKAFPGVPTQDAEGFTESRKFTKISNTVFEDKGNTYKAGSALLTEAMNETHGLKADDYVGYFTNTQGGIYLAYKQLADSTATTYSEKLSTGEMSTVARIPAAIIMSDGGANFSFNEMGITAGGQGAAQWNSRYGQPSNPDSPQKDVNGYINDNSWTVHDWTGAGPDMKDIQTHIAQADRSHRLGGVKDGNGNVEVSQKGDEWYNVFLPGKDTLGGGWNGLHGIFNIGADYYHDGTLSTAPQWNHAGVLYSSDNDPYGTPGTVLEVLLTAAYMSDVVKEHYENGWNANDAAAGSRVQLSTFTMNVDTAHVPQWGRWRLYPTLNPKDYPLDDIVKLVDAQPGKFAETFGAEAWGNRTWDEAHGTVYEGLHREWGRWKAGTLADQASMAPGINISLQTIKNAENPNSADYKTKTYRDSGIAEEIIRVDDADVLKNIAYNDAFYDVESDQLNNVFGEILSLILGKVFVPVSGSNDAGASDSVTYQDPIGEYMEIKNGSIKPSQVVSGSESVEGVYDMSLLLFGEMHGMIRAGIYDYSFNTKHLTGGSFQSGWYKGLTGTERLEGDNGLPNGCKSSEDAWNQGYIYRLNFSELKEYVPIEGVEDANSAQLQNTVYTVYRFAENEQQYNALHRNPAYGELPDSLKTKWEEYEKTGDYPDTNRDYAGTPGVYRLSDIRVWVEDYGDYVDTEGAIAPNAGYNASLYVNIPSAAVPTQVAEITLGRNGPVSYETNLGSDHPEGSKIQVTDETGKTSERAVTKEMYEAYCAQSTPVRLFYAVGLEENLIERDEDGKQTGVNVSAISMEYTAEHTNEKGEIWFISNYYSNTPYGGYSETGANDITRGDPTVTFSPSADNRYYVFQKPLPLYAHAYRVKNGNVTPVDNLNRTPWGSNKSGNRLTNWENSLIGGSDWAGGEFMGVYDNKEKFQEALQTAKGNGGEIKDALGGVYPAIEDGIIFLTEDRLSKVDAQGNGYTEDSVSFSSDDYFFLCVEYYLPTGVEDSSSGKDINGNDVPGTKPARKVTQVIARKGSAFGSGLHSLNIGNGDMLCWTDLNGNCTLDLEYNSRTDTGDNMRGRPTFEKLTYEEDALRTYLKEQGLKEDSTVTWTDRNGGETTGSILDRDVDYWLGVQTQLSEVLGQIQSAGDENAKRAKFNELFNWTVATRVGGVRVGNMFQNVQAKAPNTTETADNFYLPTLSETASVGNGLVINNYLGNNGRLAVANQSLLVTKTLNAPEGWTLTDDQKQKEFEYQVYIEGKTRTVAAQRLTWNPLSGSWQKRVESMDILTDNSSLLIDPSGSRVLFVMEDGIAKQVVAVTEGGNTRYYYANEDGSVSNALGAITADVCETADEESNLYFLYLPESEGDAYHLFASEYESGTTELPNCGTTAYCPAEYFGLATDNAKQTLAAATDSRPAGSREYWTDSAELIPFSEVREVEGTAAVAGGADQIMTLSSDDVTATRQWTHTPENCDHQAAKNGTHTSDGSETAHFTLVTVIPNPDKARIDSTIYTPYKSRTVYMTANLDFGVNRDELYDQTDATDARAKNTAKFTLKTGEGLLFTGLSRNAYWFTEHLSEQDVTDGYDLDHVDHITKASTTQTVASEDAKAKQAKDGAAFSVQGRTDAFERQAHFYNTFEPSTLSITKELAPGEGTQMNEKDKNTEFDFTLELKPGTAMPEPVSRAYPYIVTNEKGETVKTGRLLPNTEPEGLDPGFDSEQDIKAEADSNYIWKFKLRGGETMTVSDLPVGSDYTYTAAELTEGGYDVTDSETPEMGDDDERTVSGKIPASSQEPVKVTFTNTKVKPAPAMAGLELTKVINDESVLPDQKYTLEEGAFSFLVTPHPDNPEDDPIQTAKVQAMGTWNSATNTLTVQNQAPDGGGNQATATIFPADTEFKAAGTYKYTVREAIPDLTRPGMIYDTRTYTVTVEVEEDYGDTGVYTGKLKATVTVAGGEDGSIRFINRYNPNEVGAVLRAHKTLLDQDGDPLPLRGGEYSFTVTGISAEATEDAPPADEPTIAEDLPVSGGDTAVTPPDTQAEQNNAGEPSAEPPTMPDEEPTSPPAGEIPEPGLPETEESAPEDNEQAEPAQTETADEQEQETPVQTTALPTGINLPVVPLAAAPAYDMVAMADAPAEDLDSDALPTEAPADGSSDNTLAEEGSQEPQQAEETRNDAGIMPISVDLPMPTPQTTAASADGYAYFDALTFKQAGIYKYEISEEYTDKLGVVYDETVWEVTVTVTRDESTGALRADVKYQKKGSDETGSLAEFVNTQNTGSLTVKKTVTGTDGETDKLFDFTVTLTDADGSTLTDINGRYGGMMFEQGVAHFTLKHEQTLTAENLPAGTHFTVAETDYSEEGYTTTYTGQVDVSGNGVIEQGVDANVAVENRKDKAPGNLVVTKTVAGSGDQSREWHFRVELSDKRINGQYGDLFFKDGVAEFTLKHGESKTAKGLPESVTYQVTELEENLDGYATTYTDDAGTITSEQDMVAAFINDKPKPTTPDEPENPPDEPENPPDEPKNPPENLPYGPQTGDNSHLEWWIALMTVSILGVICSGAALIRERRRIGYRGRHMRHH